jgi:hypothetical protein
MTRILPYQPHHTRVLSQPHLTARNFNVVQPRLLHHFMRLCYGWDEFTTWHQPLAALCSLEILLNI